MAAYRLEVSAPIWLCRIWAAAKRPVIVAAHNEAIHFVVGNVKIKDQEVVGFSTSPSRSCPK